MDMDNSSFSNSSQSEKNEEMLDLFLPNIIVIGLYIFIGITGNSIVIGVYLRKMGHTTDNRFFIPCLAAGDMLTCVVCGMSAILLYIFHGQFSNEISCKIMWYSMTWTSLGAALILIFIAYQRYKKICTPMKQSKLMDKKFTVLGLLFLSSIIVSSPLLFTAGISKRTLPKYNRTFHICERIQEDLRNDWRKYIAFVFTGIEAMIVVSLATIITSLYLKVGWTLVKHFKSITGKNKEINMHELENEMESASEISDKDGKPKSTKKKKSTLQRLLHRRETFSRKHRYTFIFIAISGICIVTYSPRLTLMILESVDRNFWINFYDNVSMFGFLKFLNRLHIVNNIVNPFLYAMFDNQFKTQLFNLIRCESS